jgi:hypothetical protein
VKKLFLLTAFLLYLFRDHLGAIISVGLVTVVYGALVVSGAYQKSSE